MPHTSFRNTSVVSINNSSFTHIAGNQYNYNYTVDETAEIHDAQRRRKHSRKHGPTNTALDVKGESRMQKSSSHNHMDGPEFEARMQLGYSSYSKTDILPFSQKALTPTNVPHSSAIELYRPSPPPPRPRSTPGATSGIQSPAVYTTTCHSSLRYSSTIDASNPHTSLSSSSSRNSESSVAIIPPYQDSFIQNHWGNSCGAHVPPQAFPSGGPGNCKHQNRQAVWVTNAGNNQCDHGECSRNQTINQHWNASALTLPTIYARLSSQTYSYNPNMCQDQHPRHLCGPVQPEQLYQHNLNGFNPEAIQPSVSENGIYPPSQLIYQCELQGTRIQPAPPPSHSQGIQHESDTRIGAEN